MPNEKDHRPRAALRQHEIETLLWDFLEVTEPKLAILPANIPKTFHGLKLPLRPSPGNDIVSADLSAQEQRTEDVGHGARLSSRGCLKLHLAKTRFAARFGDP